MHREICGERRAFLPLWHFAMARNVTSNTKTHTFERTIWKWRRPNQVNCIITELKMNLCEFAPMPSEDVSKFYNFELTISRESAFCCPRRKALWWYPVISSTSKDAPNKCCFIYFFVFDCDTCVCSDISVVFGAAMYWLNVWMRGESIKHRSVETFRRDRTYLIFSFPI